MAEYVLFAFATCWSWNWWSFSNKFSENLAGQNIIMQIIVLNFDKISGLELIIDLRNLIYDLIVKTSWGQMVSTAKESNIGRRPCRLSHFYFDGNH